MKRTCQLCEQGDLKNLLVNVRDWEYGVEDTFGFDKCTNCGIMVLTPLPSLDSLKNYYPPEYHGFHTSEKGVISLLYQCVYALRFKEIVALMGKNGRLLDVGCADAPYFDFFKKRYPNADLVGVEFKEEIAEKGRKKGRNIISGTLMDVKGMGSFDLIIMNNLIEHVLDPIEELRTAYGLLKTGGHVIVETPNSDSWDFYIAKKYWGGLHVPRHTWIFSPKSLRILAKKANFEVRSISYLLNTDHWALSVQNYLQSKIKSRVALLFGRSWYFKYLLFVFIPLNLSQMVIGKTGAMKVVLKKT